VRLQPPAAHSAGAGLYNDAMADRQADGDAALTVYWQPGCSSCLQAKEYLRRLGIRFTSVNVRADPEAMTELAALGARTVPVVRRGDRLCFAQDLDELAAFVGACREREGLPPAALCRRLDSLLETSLALVQALPEAALETPLPGRENRRIADLAYHVFVIAEALVDCAGGATLSYAYYERLAPPAMTEIAALAGFGEAVLHRFRGWAARAGDADFQRPVETYYGTAPLARVLERSCWHVAQHARQLESLVDQLGGSPARRLGPEALAGLPLPEAVWDDEVDMRLPAGG